MYRTDAALFDMDGVLLNTEPQYDILWQRLADKFGAGVADLPKKVKGTVLKDILAKYFSHLTDSERAELLREHDEFEYIMEFPAFPGAIEFVGKLKGLGIPVGLVTSSSPVKLKRVNEIYGFDCLFDTVVTSQRVKQGKPAPDCYLLAAADLNTQPARCVVFEDALSGITAATNAGMQVIGVANTLPLETLEPLCTAVIEGFADFDVDTLFRLLK